MYLLHNKIFWRQNLEKSDTWCLYADSWKRSDAVGSVTCDKDVVLEARFWSV
jgi:uncharacterized protein (DUF2237 family)